MGSPVDMMLTICSNGSALLNKVAVLSILGKTHEKFYKTQKALRLNLGIQHQGLIKFIEMMILG